MAAKKCARCGALNNDSADTCENCHALLTLLTPANLSNPNMRQCPDCGLAVSHHAETCVHCGRFFQRFPQVVEVNRKGWISTIGWGVVISTLFFFIVGTIVLFALGFLGAILSNTTK